MWNSGCSVVKNPSANAGDAGSTPGSERPPKEGNGNPLQYSYLEKSHGEWSLVGYSPWSHIETQYRDTKQQQEQNKKPNP